MNFDIQQNQNVNPANPADGSQDDGGTFNWATNQILNNYINKAKHHALNTADQLKLMQWLIQQFTYLAELFIGGFHPGMSQQQIAQRLEKMGGFLNLLMGKMNELPPALQKQLGGFIGLLKTTLTANEYIYEGASGGKVVNPVNDYLLQILDGKGNLTQNQIDQDANDQANQILHPRGSISLQQWFDDINGSIETTCMFANDQVTSMGTLSQIVEAKLTQALNVIQELQDAAAKIVQKQFQVELQMQSRIKAQ